MKNKLSLKFISFIVLFLLVFSSFTTNAQGRLYGSQDPYVKVMGRDVTNEFFVFDIRFSKELDNWHNDEWEFDVTELPNFISFIGYEDAAYYGLSCRVVCMNRIGQAVGLDPEFYEMLERHKQMQ